MKQLQGNYTGIVLKQYENSKHKVALLDRDLGNVDSIFLSTQIMSGSLLRYFLTFRQGHYFVNNFEVIDVPFVLARIDLLFLHHVLEICFYFMPTGSLSNGVFELLMFLYITDKDLWSDQFKKFFLFKLLTTIGLYDEHPILYKPSIARLMNMSVDNMAAQPIDLECQKDVHQWLCFCVFDHPNIDSFKTVSFLRER